MSYIDGFVAAVPTNRREADVNPMPFDGQRVIYGGFEVILDA